jgi:thiamine pyrophosphokinase
MSKIIIKGSADMRVNYRIALDMSEGEFDSLSEKAQNAIIENAIDWYNECRNGEVTSIDVDDIYDASTMED